MAREPQLTVRKIVSLTPEMAQRIRQFRNVADLDSEAEAIRLFVEIGFAVLGRDDDVRGAVEAAASRAGMSVPEYVAECVAECARREGDL